MIGMLEITHNVDEFITPPNLTVVQNTKTACYVRALFIMQATTFTMFNELLLHRVSIFFCSVADSALQNMAYCCQTAHTLSKDLQGKITVAIETKHLHGIGILFFPLSTVDAYNSTHSALREAQ